MRYTRIIYNLRLPAALQFSTGWLLLLLMLAGCNPTRKLDTDFLYFQKSMDSLATIQRTPTLIKVNDLLAIQITSKTMNQAQVAVFNLPVNAAANTTPGNTEGATVREYQVNSDGTIDLPLLGDVAAAGLTREQLQSRLKGMLLNYIKDPDVIVRFSEFKIDVLGEVKMPGAHNFNKDRVTLIDAISAAGDLTDFGKRNCVMVIREELHTRKYYSVDLRSGALFQSPAYLLQPNDVVYVCATERKLKTLKNNPDGQKGWQLTFGITSALTTITTLLLTILRK
jgi:polysaccharide export outer membrane protein